MYTARHLLIQFSTVQFIVTVYAECHCFAISRNHKTLPVVFSFKVFELSDVMYFNFTVSFSTELALSCRQSCHQACATGVFCNARKIVHFGSFYKGLPCKSLIIKQPGFRSSFLVGIVNAKILSDTKPGNHFGHTGTVLCRKGFEHTVLHNVAKRVCV